jgi:eukaryotic-like serine/threonine-protein kinase
MPLQPGERLGPYEIVALIGKGGMGEVYKARDTRLDRIVALKVSDARFSERFEREAKAIGALNHSNICTLHDIGPNYLVMEFIEGDPLKGPLPLNQALKYAVQICDALDAAHRKNITHRDLKPGNILVTASGVKLLDFGLAQVAATKSPDGATQTMPLTEAGAVMGTAAYMSPEQAKGEEVDARSDVFSFGVVLYEMLSGRRAFARNSSIETMSAILRDEPAALDAPSHVSEIVMRCLRKSSKDRFQTVSDVRRALDQASAKPAEQQPSIAVLPFANLSGDKEQEYFSDGLAEEIINALVKIPGLKVIARTSAFAFKGQNTDIRKIAETLGVANILEGSVRRSGNRIRVTAQLVTSSDGSHLWSERYDREMTDVFAVQDEISAAITGALRVKLSGESAPQRYMPKMPAYEAYLKAKYLQAAVTPESLELARRCYESAIELDPMFALAHVGLGYYWLGFTIFGRCPAHEAVPSARAEVQRALLIDPSLPEAHALLGYLAALYDLDWAAAELHFSSPLSKQAGFSLIRPIYGAFQFLRGNVEQAIELAQRAIEEDPLEVWPRMNLHAYLQAAGRDDEAIQQLSRVLELDETQVVARVSIAMIHADRGELPEALHAARRAYAIGPWLPDTIGVLAGLLRRNGQEDESQALVRSLGSGEAPGDARAHALFHLLTGEVDRGADWAEKAIEQRDNSMMYYLRFVVCKKLRASHRWPKIAEMVNLPVLGGW